MPRGRKLQPQNKHLMQRLVDILQLYDGSDDGLFLPIKGRWEAARVRQSIPRPT